MIRSLLRNITLWLIILTILCSSQGRGYGYIWCITEDGETHLESPLEKHCATDLCSAADDESHFVFENDSARGPCIDLVPTFDPLQQRIITGCTLDAPCAPHYVTLLEWSALPALRQIESKLIFDSPPRIATTLLHQRTVVLLI